MKRTLFFPLLLPFTTLAAISVATAAVIPVPNGDFDNWPAIGDGGATNAGWSSVPSGQTPASNVGRNDEMWTGGGSTPSSFGSGWQMNGKARTDGKWGLQQPSNAHHVKVEASEPYSLASPFNGNFIAFVNLTEADGAGEADASVQSGVIGNLNAGQYTLTVAFGNRRNTNWNDYRGEISLVANPVDDGGLGTSGGDILGAPAVIAMVPDPVPSDAAVDQTIMDLTYVLNVPAGDPNIGQPYAIRIDVANLGTRDGATTDLSTFTQANFDNVRLQFIPEPAAGTLSAVMLAVFAAGRRRSPKKRS